MLSEQCATAQVRALLEDETTFRTMVIVGLPSSSFGGKLQTPPVIQFNLFKSLESRSKDPGEFMDAAIEYVEYTRDANDLTELAILSRRQGAAQAITVDYLDRAFEAARGAGKAIDRLVPLLPE